MNFPIEPEINGKGCVCFQCACPIEHDPVVFSFDAMEWEAGRVNPDQYRDNPEMMPSPASTRKLSRANIRLRILDQCSNPVAGRYLTILDSQERNVEFCSTACLRQFFNAVVDAFESSPKDRNSNATF